MTSDYEFLKRQKLKIQNNIDVKIKF